MKNAIALIPALAVLLSGCAPKTLTLGSGSSAASTSAPTSCASSDCASYTLSCSQGTPTNVECVLDTSDEFVQPFCTLTGTCSDTAGATCTWTAPSPCSGSGSGSPEACAWTVGGSGTVSVEVDPPGEAGASTSTLAAYFDSATENPDASFGDCVYEEDGADLVHSGQVGVPAPSPGRSP